jgi:hypothetical protein
MQGQNATLVVIEFGASWPSWLNPSGSGNIAVVAQHYEGPASSLVIQVASRLSRLVAVGWRIDDVVLVSNGRTDLESQAARALLARGLLLHLREVGGVRFVFTVAALLGRRASHALHALTSELEASALASGISLCVRVGEGEPIYARPVPARLSRAS